MILGVLAWLELEESLKILADLGYTGVQLDLKDLGIEIIKSNNLLLSFPSKEVRNFKKLADKYNLKIPIYHSFVPFRGKEFGYGKEITKEILTTFKNHSKIMSKLGAKYFILHIHAYSSKKEDLEFAIRVVNMVKQIFAKRGQELLVENEHPPSLFVSPEQISKVLQKINCSICLDTAHVLESSLDLDKFYALLRDKIKVVHLSDYDGKDAHKALGDGVLTKTRVFKKLLHFRPIVLEATHALGKAASKKGVYSIYKKCISYLKMNFE